MEPVRFSITEDMYTVFWKLQFASNLKRGTIVLVIVVGLLSGLAYLADGHIAAFAVGIGGAVGAVSVLLISRFVLIPRQSRKSWQEHKLIQEELEVTMREDGFSITQPSAHVDAKWEQMLAWDENSDLFAIYLNRQMAYLFPKDQVDAKRVDFARDRLIASGLVTKGTRRK